MNEAYNLDLLVSEDDLNETGYNESNAYNEPVIDDNIDQTQAEVSRNENEAELQELARQNEAYNERNEQEYANAQDSISNDIENNAELSNTELIADTQNNEKTTQTLESSIINENYKEQIAQEMAKERENKESKERENVESKEQTNTQNIESKQQDSNTQYNVYTQEAAFASLFTNQDTNTELTQEQEDALLNIDVDSNGIFNQDQSLEAMNYLINKEPKQKENLQEQDESLERGLNYLPENQPLVNNIINQMLELENMYDEQEKGQENENSAVFDKERFDRNQKRIEDAENDLDKALDNLTKVRSFADFVRAFYTLNEALYQMKESSDIMQSDPFIREMILKANNKESMSKEFCKKCVKVLLKPAKKLHKCYQVRCQEKEIKKTIEDYKHKYEMSNSPFQKKDYAKQISNNLIAAQQYKKFEIRYPQLVKDSQQLLKEHKKEFGKESLQDKKQEANLGRSR